MLQWPLKWRPPRRGLTAWRAHIRCWCCTVGTRGRARCAWVCRLFYCCWRGGHVGGVPCCRALLRPACHCAPLPSTLTPPSQTVFIAAGAPGAAHPLRRHLPPLRRVPVAHRLPRQDRGAQRGAPQLGQNAAGACACVGAACGRAKRWALYMPVPVLLPCPPRAAAVRLARALRPPRSGVFWQFGVFWGFLAAGRLAVCPRRGRMWRTLRRCRWRRRRRRRCCATMQTCCRHAGRRVLSLMAAAGAAARSARRSPVDAGPLAAGVSLLCTTFRFSE